jgi:hypothetical protein
MYKLQAQAEWLCTEGNSVGATMSCLLVLFRRSHDRHFERSREIPRAPRRAKYFARSNRLRSCAHRNSALALGMTIVGVPKWRLESSLEACATLPIQAVRWHRLQFVERRTIAAVEQKSLPPLLRRRGSSRLSIDSRGWGWNRYTMHRAGLAVRAIGSDAGVTIGFRCVLRTAGIVRAAGLAGCSGARLRYRCGCWRGYHDRRRLLNYHLGCLRHIRRCAFDLTAGTPYCERRDQSNRQC